MSEGYLIVNAYALLVLLILAYIFFKKQRLHKIEDNTYAKIIIFSIVTIVMGFSSGLIRMMIDTSLSRTLFSIISKIYMVGLLSVYFQFLLYTIYISKLKINNYKTIETTLMIINALSAVIALFLPLGININNGSVEISGASTIFIYTMFGIVYILLTIILFVSWKNLLNKKYLPIFLFLIEGITFYILQVFFVNINYLTNPFVVITVLIMYFTIENPDVKMLEEMTMLRDRADKANNAKSEFLSSMSHEIRTPLNAIVGFSESLKEDEIPEESMDKVEDIIMASNNLLEIVNGILDISKIEANKLEIIEKEYEIEELWNELVVLTKARIGDRGLDFRVNIDPTIPKVLYGDNTRLKQVILNVLTNAVKYTKEGFVDFRVTSVIKDNIVKLIIAVEDSGIGIKEENLPRLFGKFDRLSVEKSITIEGTGLGLAITKKLVELMGGRIVVQSIYGKGSKFTIIIDQKIVSYEVQHQKETTESNTKVVDIKGAKVLLVDDNELNIKVASTLLKKYNLNIDSCISGFECIERIKKGNQYDIILLDDMMPKMSGKETLVKLKQIQGFNIPVIALTANAIEGMKEEYLKSGFNDYLSKPIEKKELERVLRTYIAKKEISNTNTVHTEHTTSILSENIVSDVDSSQVIAKEEIPVNNEPVKEEKVVEEVVEEPAVEEAAPEITEEVEETGTEEITSEEEPEKEEEPTEENPEVTEEPVENSYEEETDENKETSEEIPKDKEERPISNPEEIDLPSLKKEEPPKPGRVLVVDDNELNIKVAERLISKYVGVVDCVYSGSECIAKIIDDDDYDLILMDDMMPDLDGPATMDNLRDIEGFNIPVVLITASDFDDVEEKIDEHHFAGYLGKPINKEELIKVLTKFIK